MKYLFNCNFKKYIMELINEKQAIGYKYYTEAGMLKRFDIFCIQNYKTVHFLSKDVAEHWAIRTSTESISTLKGRITPVRQLAIYMCKLGIKAYVLPKNNLPRSSQYIPYIFSDEELSKIFYQTDNCHQHNEVPIRHLLMPVLFRMLYSCGLRVSEARKLKLIDVDLKQGVLTIYEAKNGKDRLVPMSVEMTTLCNNYVDKAHLFSLDTDYFFPSFDGQPIKLQNVYKNFRKFLWQAEISHGGRGKGPRVHDFRHTFAVHCLRKWVLEGKDLNAYLPVLKTYMGHYSFSDTAYYLRLTADIYPHITTKVSEKFGNIIPVIGDCINENN